jgi:hypothetical protein
MSFHNQVALRARLDGQSSKQFSDAAQKKADATWIYLIIVAVVWYFSNWMWAMIPLALTILNIAQSISATLVAQRLQQHEKKQNSATPADTP